MVLMKVFYDVLKMELKKLLYTNCISRPLCRNHFPLLFLQNSFALMKALKAKCLFKKLIFGPTVRWLGLTTSVLVGQQNTSFQNFYLIF